MTESDKELEEQAKKWREERKKKIEVTVNTEGIQEVIKRNQELEERLKDSEEETADYRSKLIIVAQKKFDDKKRKLNAPDSIESPEQLKAWAESRNLERKLSQRGGEGQIPLSQQSGTSRKEYDTVDAMIDDLRRQASRENEEGENAKAILDEFWRKSLSGQKELKRGSGEMQYHGKKKPSGKEEGMNEERAREFRKRRKQREEDEDDE